jgi:hypothetical protein
MKYSYKQEMKKLLTLFFLLSATFVVVAQVPGTPYGLATLSPATIPDGTGSFAGRTCFDVAKENNTGECDNLSIREEETLAAKGSRADFSNTLTRNQTYTFTPWSTVSNVRFYAVEAGSYSGQIVGNIAGGNSGNNISSAVTCSITYKDNLNNLASGKTNANALTVDIYVVYNDDPNNTGMDRKLKLTAKIKDCACCGAYSGTGVWLHFMCHNLGPEVNLTNYDQYQAVSSGNLEGLYFQWGKPRAWPTSGVVADWSSALNNVINAPGGNSSATAWGFGGGKTRFDPCPVGWRVTTLEQFMDIFASNPVSGGSTKQVGHALILRNSRFWQSNGTLNLDMSFGHWTASHGTLWNESMSLSLYPTVVGILSRHSAEGRAVRCVAE